MPSRRRLSVCIFDYSLGSGMPLRVPWQPHSVINVNIGCQGNLDRNAWVARANLPAGLNADSMIEAVLPFPNIDPVLIHIYGPISIRWYALAYIAGLLLGWGYVLRLMRTP